MSLNSILSVQTKYNARSTVHGRCLQSSFRSVRQLSLGRRDAGRCPSRPPVSRRAARRESPGPRHPAPGRAGPVRRSLPIELLDGGSILLLPRCLVLTVLLPCDSKLVAFPSVVSCWDTPTHRHTPARMAACAHAVRLVPSLYNTLSSASICQQLRYAPCFHFFWITTSVSQ